jgi:hypothetical protein
VPRYTSDYDTAHRLAWHLLDSRKTVLEEVELEISAFAERAFTPAFRAGVRDAEGNMFTGPVANRPTVALLLATLDYLIATDE